MSYFYKRLSARNLRHSPDKARELKTTKRCSSLIFCLIEVARSKSMLTDPKRQTRAMRAIIATKTKCVVAGGYLIGKRPSVKK